MLRFSPDVVKKVVEETRERFGLSEESPAAVRVDVRHAENLRLEAKVWEAGGIHLTIDEPPERGGGGAGAAPLPLFIAGASSCFLMQCVKLAAARGLNLSSISITAVGRFDRRLGSGFKEIIYELRIEGEEPEEAVLKMLEDAERMCFTHNTLKKCLSLRVKVSYNGAPLEER